MNKTKEKLKSRIKQLETILNDPVTNKLKGVRLEVFINGNEVTVEPMKGKWKPEIYKSAVPEMEWIRVIEPKKLDLYCIVKKPEVYWKQLVCQRICDKLCDEVRKQLLS